MTIVFGPRFSSKLMGIGEAGNVTIFHECDQSVFSHRILIGS